MPDLLLWGATGQAKVLHEALLGTGMQVVAIVDRRAVPPPLAGIPLLLGEDGLDRWLNAWLAARGEVAGLPTLSFAVAIGGGRGADRLSIAALLTGRGLAPMTIVHRTAFVASTASIGAGCQILAQAAVCTDATLGEGVIVNTAASVDHDCNIGAGAHLAPGARLAGEVIVGERAFIGTGAIVLPRICIGADAVVGAGAVVTRDVPAQATVVGNPARIRVGG
jgi:sugar O-acyltransferase (sialic acid O-acetyltransferase NeuD family)